MESSLLEEVRKAVPDVDLAEVHWEMVEAARVQAGALIADLSKTKRKTVNSLIRRAFEQGWSDTVLKRRLKEVVGLDPKRAMAVQNFRSALLAGGAPPGRAERDAKAYANRLLNQRIALIASQEIRMATRTAQRAVWKRMQEIGDLSPYAVRVTRVHKDELVCSICRPENGKRRSLKDTKTGPPFHPRCRCDEEVVDLGIEKREDGPMRPEDFEIEKVSSRVYPDLERKKGGPDNWVEQVGGLPDFIERVAKHLHYEQGMSIGRAIATAVSQCKKWAAKGNPKAAKAIAEWEAKKAKSKMSKLDPESFRLSDRLIAKQGAKRPKGRG